MRHVESTTPPSFLAWIPHAIESHWDNVWAPRLAGLPVNIVYAARIEGVGLAQATYVFDPDTFIQDEQTRQLRYRPTESAIDLDNRATLSRRVGFLKAD